MYCVPSLPNKERENIYRPPAVFLLGEGDGDREGEQGRIDSLLLLRTWDRFDSLDHDSLFDGSFA